MPPPNTPLCSRQITDTSYPEFDLTVGQKPYGMSKMHVLYENESVMSFACSGCATASSQNC